MKKKVLLFVLLITFLLAAVLVACGERDVPQQEAEPSEPTILYDREVAEEKYLKERVSDATAIYYKSSESGAFGDDRSNACTAEKEKRGIEFRIGGSQE